MPHPRIVSFLNGAVDELLAAHRKSEGGPAAVKGTVREIGVRRAIEHSLPATVRLHNGEILDPFGGQSGQLDGIVVAASGAALATNPEEPRIVLAEAALGVIESKSDISGQWGEVRDMWTALRKLRRYTGQPGGVTFGGSTHPSDHAFPVLIIGRSGWQKATTLRDKAKELFESFGAAYAPPVLVAQLDPPGLGLVMWRGDNPINDGVVFPHEERWRVLATPLYVFAERAQRYVSTQVNWGAYLF